MFVINGQPKDIGGFPESKDAAPEGGETAYVDTWALGKLPAGEERTFKWSVTAVRGGDYKLDYEVAAGLDGKAKAVGVGGSVPRGQFAGTISDAAPNTRVADDGRTILRGTSVGPPFGRFTELFLDHYPAARTPGTRAPAPAGTSGTMGRSSSARTSRTSSRACCG